MADTTVVCLAEAHATTDSTSLAAAWASARAELGPERMADALREEARRAHLEDTAPLTETRTTRIGAGRSTLRAFAFADRVRLLALHANEAVCDDCVELEYAAAAGHQEAVRRLQAAALGFRHALADMQNVAAYVKRRCCCCCCCCCYLYYSCCWAALLCARHNCAPADLLLLLVHYRCCGCCCCCYSNHSLTRLLAT